MTTKVTTSKITIPEIIYSIKSKFWKKPKKTTKLSDNIDKVKRLVDYANVKKLHERKLFNSRITMEYVRAYNRMY